MKNVLVTGGAGYIGSHACVELLEAGYRVLVIDNLSNSKTDALERVGGITGKSLDFIRCDLLDRDKLRKAFDVFRPDTVMHFAGLKAVGESVEKPLLYYRNNVSGTVNLLDVMVDSGVRNLVFSSSCTVYGEPDTLPITEDSPLGAVNPYGQTKLTIEYMLRDVVASRPDWNVSVLRYFNPVGAHPSGEIGEDPLGIPNNLMPYITKVAVGELPELSVWGDDYDTPDGTCIRDYIHVVDLARGHIKALQKLATDPGLMVHNLGTGRGYSVKEVIAGFRRATGQDIPCRIAGRRAGDAPAVYADPSRAAAELSWTAEFDLDAMCADAWRWQQKNPEGY
ncbi:UDP-glucose 4-epimerase GalE [Elongatibacter sediminis]|uniref:UDP-glucose 4-epimerase n=1 Tax=Elongatibacter sediminis TaxID=3119006 RepID=A0AAW9RFM6_9GAMM